MAVYDVSYSEAMRSGRLDVIGTGHWARRRGPTTGAPQIPCLPAYAMVNMSELRMDWTP